MSWYSWMISLGNQFRDITPFVFVFSLLFAIKWFLKEENNYYIIPAVAASISLLLIVYDVAAY